jgi:hypothetical protein
MKLEMNLAWNDALRLLRLNRHVIAVIAGVFFFLPYFAFMLVAPDPMTGMSAAASSDPEAMLERLSAFYGQVWWVIVLIVILQAVGMLGLIALLTDRRRPTVGEALKRGGSKAVSYIAAYLLLGMAGAFGLLVLATVGSALGAAALGSVAVLIGMVAWLVLFVRFSLVPPILVKENVGNPLAALARSWSLTRGNGGRLFAFYLLLFVAYFVLLLVISMMLGGLFGLLGPQAQHFGEALIESVFNAAWVTIFLAVLSAVHGQFTGASAAAASDTPG